MADPVAHIYINGRLQPIRYGPLSPEEEKQKKDLEFSIIQLEYTVTHDKIHGPHWPSEWFNGREDDLQQLYNLVTQWRGQVDRFSWISDGHDHHWYNTNSFRKSKKTKLAFFNPTAYYIQTEREQRHALERFLFKAVWEREMGEHLNGVPFLAQLIGSYWTEAIVVKQAPKEEVDMGD